MKCSCLKSHLLGSSLLFLTVGVGHSLRVLMGWSLEIGGWSAPVWLSVLAAVLTLGLAFNGLKEMKHLKK